MKIKFSEIPDKLKYPLVHRGELSTLHSQIIEAVAPQYVGTFKQRQHIIQVMNTLSAMVVSGDALPVNMSGTQLLEKLDIIDDANCRATLRDIYLSEKDIIWDLPSVLDVVTPVSEEPVKPIAIAEPEASQHPQEQLTPKEDLYLKPPTIPQFDIKRPWKARLIDSIPYVIYTSYPEVPTKQNEISCTTDISRMTAKDLYNLFPNRFIQTRATSMYEYAPTLSYDESLGNIIPVEGFTKQQLIDNLIQYPHIFKLMRKIDDQLVSFYTHIEIDGELHRIADVWSSLPESQVIPFTQEYIKEYIVRRYLLERDINHVQHKYPLYGTLDPFLTLFMPANSYAAFGYKNSLELAKKCVEARVAYKQSRNPVLRRITDA